MASMSPSTVFPLLAPYRESGFVLTASGELVALLVHEGRDPDGLDDSARSAVSLAVRTALCGLPNGARVQQWYVHAPGALPAPRHRGHAVVDALTQARHAHLHAGTLYNTRLYTAIILPTNALTSAIRPLAVPLLLMEALVDKSARQRLRSLFDLRAERHFSERALDDSVQRLNDTLASFERRLSVHSATSRATLDETFGLARFLATYDVDAFASPAPDAHWYMHLLRSRAYAAQIDGHETLRLEAPARYARIASVIRQIGGVEPGLWARYHPSALSVQGTYILSINATQLDPLARNARFGKLSRDLSRRDFNTLRAVLKPDALADYTNALSPEHQELQVAERLDDAYFDAHFSAIAIGETPAAAQLTERALDHALLQARMAAVWEVPGLERTYQATQLGARPYQPRCLLVNASQLGAASLSYRYSQGQSKVADLAGEEPLYWFTTRDGQPFGFSPFVGGKSTVLGLGASRSGKSFAKNQLAAAWPKWGGVVVPFDYDSGSDALARLYGDDAAQFAQSGMNPFRAQGRDVGAFKAHMTRLVLGILSSNDDPAMRGLDPGEQIQMDNATDALIALPAHLQTLTTWSRHLAPATAQKLNRWLRATNGRYGHLLDNQDDDIGEITRLVTTFNLSAIRDDDAAKRPVLEELFWRVTLAFEDPTRLLQPKTMIFDEAHYALRDNSGFAQLLVTKARTWAKYLASIQLWTHTPQNYESVPDWHALRSSASTFIFTATPDAEPADYMRTFGLTAGDVQTIRTMQPQRELYIVQPDIELRKVVVLDPDPRALIWSSSTPRVVAKRDALARVHGLDVALDLMTEV